MSARFSPAPWLPLFLIPRFPLGSRTCRGDPFGAATELQWRQGAAWRHHQGREAVPAPDAHCRRDGGRRYAERNGAKRPWLVQLLARRKLKVAAVALANKNARMILAVVTSGERYREPQVAWVTARATAPEEVGKGQQTLMQQAGWTAGSGNPKRPSTSSACK